MPTYRTPTGWMHLKMAKGKAPAPCAARIPNGSAIVGSTMRCCAISSFLCDHLGLDGKTCDAPLCEEHATQTGPDRHLCPLHVEQQR